MGRIFPGNLAGSVLRAIVAMAAAWLVASCAKIELAPHLRPLSSETMMLLGKKGMNAQSPIFVRIFKEESELEVWKQRSDGRFYPFKTYPICNWSGQLGPKTEYGDMQAPEGFYTITREQMNPNSHFHLALNLGYPNAFDKAHRRTGDYLMVHGKCKSAGCYAMTDALMEEIYGLARESFLGGNDSFQVQALPFRMTDANMARHKDHPAYAFWKTLKEGYDYFELTRQPPVVGVCNRNYVVNVALADAARMKPDRACPVLHRPKPSPFTVPPGQQLAEQHIVVPGPKMHGVMATEPRTEMPVRSGLTKSDPAPSWWARAASHLGFAAGK
jgi:murein L,D-transpeptidase YafK